MRDIRKNMRRLRRALSPREQHQHAEALARQLSRLNEFKYRRRIAFYMSADGEIDLSPLIAMARGHGKSIHLPTLKHGSIPRLWFVGHRIGDPLRRNRYAIAEPDIKRRSPTPPWALNLILMPLVAFDTRCNRLGMGGGYYDRTLNYLLRRTRWHQPLLIGVAHDLQRIERIDTHAWDIPLDLVVTETRVYRRGIR